MSPLAEVQRAIARAIMTGETDMDGAPAFVGRISPAAAFRVHRGTVLGGLTEALRLTFPTVENLVGAAFFDHAAVDFIASEPPAMANLSAYGDGYPAFLEAFPPVAALPYLADVARLDLAIDRVQRTLAVMPRQLPIDVSVVIEVPGDLHLLVLAYPADDIRGLIDADDGEGLGRLDMTAAHYWVAVWRSSGGSRVRRLAEPAGRFLAALLDGLGPDDAFSSALAGVAQEVALAAIKTDVFTAPFATILPLSEPTAP